MIRFLATLLLATAALNADVIEWGTPVSISGLDGDSDISGSASGSGDFASGYLANSVTGDLPGVDISLPFTVLSDDLFNITAFLSVGAFGYPCGNSCTIGQGPHGDADLSIIGSGTTYFELSVFIGPGLGQTQTVFLPAGDYLFSISGNASASPADGQGGYASINGNVTLTDQTPEPSYVWTLGIGLAALAATRRLKSSEA